ncbi:hypothetical protein B2J93_5755 [Marssonina coronariae]|uniref:Uncharacterized protein n=1 Tax=Diplocarpon coronariae TaxID=2795749 RepID=A0A218YYR5_9HELO|nr:hypothetical protein B2J93_5755 [Marssonina coronariae]
MHKLPNSFSTGSAAAESKTKHYDGGPYLKSVGEFSRAMRSSGPNPNPGELAQIIREVDLDVSALSHQVTEEADSQAEFRAAWKEFASAFEGSITAAQLRQVAAALR